MVKEMEKVIFKKRIAKKMDLKIGYFMKLVTCSF